MTEHFPVRVIISRAINYLNTKKFFCSKKRYEIRLQKNSYSLMLDLSV